MEDNKMGEEKGYTDLTAEEIAKMRAETPLKRRLAIRLEAIWRVLLGKPTSYRMCYEAPLRIYSKTDYGVLLEPFVMRTQRSYEIADFLNRPEGEGWMMYKVGKYLPGGDLEKGEYFEYHYHSPLASIGFYRVVKGEIDKNAPGYFSFGQGKEQASDDR